MAGTIIGRTNHAEAATIATSTPMQTAWPVSYAVNRRLRRVARSKKSARRQMSITLDLGATYSSQAARIVSLIRHTLGTTGRYRIQASSADVLGDPDALFDFTGGYTDGRTHPNDLDPRITFSRASGGTFWRDGVLFGSEYVTTSSIAATTAQTSWTVRAGGKWCAGDLVYVLPTDGTANISLTATVASYSGTLLTLESITAGSDTTTTKTAWKIVYRGPRLDSDPYTKKRRGLLIEGAATNVMTWSEGTTTESIDTGWATAGYNTNRFVNAGTAPDGTNTATLLTANNNDVWGHAMAVRRGTISSPYVGTASIYLKAAGTHRARVQFRADTTGHGGYADVDLRAGTITATGNANSGTHLNSWIEKCPDGWYRVSVCSDMTSASNGLQFIIGLYLLDATGTVAYTAAPLPEGLFVWGVQMEANAYFPSSYIPTQGAAVSRSADVATISGSSFTGFFKQGAGTLYVRGTSQASGILLVIDDGSFTNRLPQIAVGSGLANEMDVVTAGAAVASLLSGGTHVPGEPARFATAWAGNDFALSVNGYTASTDAAGVLPIGLTTLRIGQFHTGGTHANGHIEEIVYFSRRLPNARLEAWSNRGATINSDFTACTVDLPVEYTFSRASGGAYIDSLGRVAGYSPSITAPIVPQTTLANRVKNGDFASDALWTKGTGWSIASGVATKSAGTTSDLTQTIPTVPGQVYSVAVEVTSFSAGTLTVDAGGTDLQTGIAATGRYTNTFTATSATTTINFQADATFAGSIDNVIVTLDQGLRIPVGAGGDWQVGQLVRIDPQDGTANTYMIGKVVSYDGAILLVDVVEAAAPELVSNGHFTSATTGWTAANGASLSVSSGQLVVTSDGTAFSQATQSISTASGYTYVADLEFSVGTGTPANYVWVIGSNPTGSTTSSTMVRAVMQQTAVASSAEIRLEHDGSNSASDSILFDNISVKRAHTDWIVSLAGPRFTHDTDGTALGLMVEPAATNLGVNSEDVTAWSSIGSPTVTANQGEDPTGAYRADRVQFGATATDQVFQSFTASIGTAYTGSCYVRAYPGSGTTKIRTKHYTGATDVDSADLTISETEWTRVSATWTQASTTTSNFAIRNASTGNSDVLIFGMQIEAGSEATSYHPTFGVSRSRSGDVCTVEGDEFTARVREDEGAIYLAGIRNSAVPSGGAAVPLEVGDGTTNERITFYIDANEALRMAVVDGGASQADFSAGTITPGTEFAMAAAYKANDLAASLSGAAVQTDTSATMPTTTTLYVGRDNAGTALNGTFSRLIYKPERVTDADLVAMTTSGADLSDYTMPGDLSDAYAGAYDSGKTAAWQTGQTKADARTVFSADKTYRRWRIDLIDYAGPDSDPGTTDDGVALDLGYLGLWQAWEPPKSRVYGGSSGLASRTEVSESLSGAEFFDRRDGYRTEAFTLEGLSGAEARAVNAWVQSVDIDTPIYLVMNPDATGEALDDDMLCRLETLTAIERAMYEWNTIPLRFKEWIR